MGIISIFYCFIFLLGPVLFSTEIDAHDILTATVIEANGNRINLRWVKTEQYLANENLRIWETDKTRSFYQNEHLTNELGIFETYHDLDKSSAIIFFKKYNSIFGTIGKDYDIIGLPISELNYEQHIEQNTTKWTYIHAMKKSNSAQSCLKSFWRPSNVTADPFQYIQQPSCSHWRKRPHDADEFYLKLLSEKRSRFDVNVPVQTKTHLGNFYPEILILVNHEMIKACINMRTAFIIILMYMNAVSMLFAKLKDHVNIHINIASIIFETKQNAFSFSRLKFINVQSDYEYKTSLFDSIHDYINSNSYANQAASSRIFHEDAFDFFLFMTPDLRPSQLTYDTSRGFSTNTIDILQQKTKMHLSYMLRRQLGAVVPPSNMLENYVDVARQIAHLMRVEDDLLELHFIMGNDHLNHYCQNSLQWSTKSVESFKQFFRQDTNRCILMNQPRSLYKFDMPRETLTPKQQCNCYNYEISPLHAKTLISTPFQRACQVHLPCTQSVKYKITMRAPYPVEGTPCDAGKVCWRRTCVPSNN